MGRPLGAGGYKAQNARKGNDLDTAVSAATNDAGAPMIRIGLQALYSTRILYE